MAYFEGRGLLSGKWINFSTTDLIEKTHYGLPDYVLYSTKPGILSTKLSHSDITCGNPHCRTRNWNGFLFTEGVSKTIKIDTYPITSDILIQSIVSMDVNTNWF